MDSEWLIRLLYGIVVSAVLIVLFLSKKQEREVRLAADAFAFAFLRIANRVAPRPVGANPSQKTVQSIMSAATGPESVQDYAAMTDALDQVGRACGRNRRLRRDFALPMEDVFAATRVFLVYCERGGEGLDREPFTHFLRNQADYRAQLFKRISAGAGEEFHRLNRDYPLT